MINQKWLIQILSHINKNVTFIYTLLILPLLIMQTQPFAAVMVIDSMLSVLLFIILISKLQKLKGLLLVMQILSLIPFTAIYYFMRSQNHEGTLVKTIAYLQWIKILSSI